MRVAKAVDGHSELPVDCLAEAMCQTRAGESGSWFGIAPNEAKALPTALAIKPPIVPAQCEAIAGGLEATEAIVARSRDEVRGSLRVSCPPQLPHILGSGPMTASRRAGPSMGCAACWASAVRQASAQPTPEPHNLPSGKSAGRYPR